MRQIALGTFLLYSGVAGVCGVAAGQPAGWTHLQAFTGNNATGADLMAHQVAISIDTAARISAGEMQSNCADIRVATDCSSNTFLPQWIEAPNTASTKVWVRTDIPTTGAPLYVFWGNHDAAPQGDLETVFAGHSQAADAPFSATMRMTSGDPGGLGSSQRGFRFSPNEDVFLVQLGKCEPTGTPRYVTLFDFVTQTKLLQVQVSGPAAEYSYVDVQPFQLKAGTHYVLQLYQAASDGYYFGTSTQLDPRLTYHDMRYCNDCTPDTFPTSALDDIVYGYPDFGFIARSPATPQPETVAGGPATATCDPDGSPPSCGDGTLNLAAGEECEDSNQVDTDDCLNNCMDATCGDGVTHVNVEDCDDGNQTDTDACRNSCQAALCGDGVVQAGVEDCDDTNQTDTDTCRNDCTAATCGDGIVQSATEACDDGNQVDTDACRNGCLQAACGDGVVQTDIEECDDDNTAQGDGCSTTCHTESPTTDAGSDSGAAPVPDAGSDAGEEPMADAGRDSGATETEDAAAAEGGKDAGTRTFFLRGNGCDCRVERSGEFVGADDAANAAWALVFGAVLWRQRRRSQPRRPPS